MRYILVMGQRDIVGKHAIGKTDLGQCKLGLMNTIIDTHAATYFDADQNKWVPIVAA